MEILVVEDDFFQRQLYAALMERADFHVVRRVF